MVAASCDLSPPSNRRVTLSSHPRQHGSGSGTTLRDPTWTQSNIPGETCKWSWLFLKFWVTECRVMRNKMHLYFNRRLWQSKIWTKQRGFSVSWTLCAATVRWCVYMCMCFLQLNWLNMRWNAIKLTQWGPPVHSSPGANKWFKALTWSACQWWSH